MSVTPVRGAGGAGTSFAGLLFRCRRRREATRTVMTHPISPDRTRPLPRALGFLRWFLLNIPYLARADTPRGVWGRYLTIPFRRRGLERYKDHRRRFQEAMRSGRFSDDWFCGNIPYWLAAFHRYGLCDRPLRVLEIGSWEGLSSRFILDTLTQAHLTCVDTWQGADEHRYRPLPHIEANFDANLAVHAQRLAKFKGTSLAFFGEQHKRAQFDLVYIDGSHHCDDVIVDAVKGFEQLKVGGVMILDDYLWRFYPNRNDNPAAAINAFLRLKAGCYELFMVYAQVILRKTADRRGAAAPAAEAARASTDTPARSPIS